MGEQARPRASAQDDGDVPGVAAVVRITKKWGKVNGERQLVEKQHRVQSWWRTGANGSVVLFVRLGGKPSKFDTGKSRMSRPTVEMLPCGHHSPVPACRKRDLDRW